MKHRLSEYFAELDEIAKTDKFESEMKRVRDLKVFQNDTPLSNCTFTNQSANDQFSGIFICDGKAFDYFGNPVDLDEEDEDWKK